MASDLITEAESRPATEDMEIENRQSGPNPEECETADKEAPNGNGNSKREREGDEEEEKEENISVTKKPKVEEKSAEEKRMEKLEEERENGDGEAEDPAKENSDPVILGPKTFGSSVDMFDYFYKLLHHWSPNVNVNKYEYMVLLDLIKKGHPEPDEKIRSGINAFEIRHHPMWKSRCFFVIRADDTVEDFSFRKCVDHILPLPENMKIKSDVNQALRSGGKKGGGGRRGGGRGGHGRGRGGMARR